MYGKGKHALQPLNAVLPPGVIGLEDDFRVTGGKEPVALAFQFGFQFTVIIDAAVEDERQAEFGIDHRLLPMIGQVDNFQPPVSEGNPTLGVDPAGIRATGRQSFDHPAQRVRIGRRTIEGDVSANATHIALSWPFRDRRYRKK